MLNLRRTSENIQQCLSSWHSRPINELTQ